MSRKLDFGESGEIGLTPERKDVTGKWRKVDKAQSAKRWRASARYRTWDGDLQYVDAVGRTRHDAEVACKTRIKDRLRKATADIRATTPLKDVCRAYLDWLERPGTSTADRTIYDYNRSYTNVIEEDPRLGALKLTEANDTQRLRRFLQDLADERGTGTATRVKSILSGAMRFAVANGVLDENKVRQVGPVRATKPYVSPRDHTRAMTRAERDAVIALAYELAVDPYANPRTARKRRTSADQVAFLAGTGVRIDEARRLQWPDLRKDWTEAAVRGTKTVNSNRVLSVPSWLAECLEDRYLLESTEPGYDFDPSGYVFAAPGLLHNKERWEASNNSGAIRQILDKAGLEWAIPHTFRRTVATLLDQAGVPISRIADQLGHVDPAMTMKKYLGRDPHGDKTDMAEHL